MRLRVIAALTSVTFSMATATAAQAGDAERGASLFEACAGCHQIGKDAETVAAPHLNSIVGRAAAQTDFAHSQVLAAAGADGFIWTEDALDAFLADPQAVLPGVRMRMAGMADANDRADLIAFLGSHDGERMGFAVAPEVLAIDGDTAFGEYLAGECSACHGAGGDIPDIRGWQAARFVTTLHAYRSGARQHPVMQMVAGRLDDEMIAALAAWFAEQETETDGE